MFRNNLFKNTFFATAAFATNGALFYGMIKDHQHEYEKLKKAHPNADITWEYQKGNETYAGLYGTRASGNYKWVAKEPEPTATPNMKR